VLTANQTTTVINAGLLTLAAGQTAVVSGWLGVQGNPTLVGDITLYCPNASAAVAVETVNPAQVAPGVGNIALAFEAIITGPVTNQPVVLIAQPTVAMTVQSAGTGGFLSVVVC
jgi:hypothetical protein